MISSNLQQNVELIVKELGCPNQLIVRNFSLGKVNPIKAAAIYINGLTNKYSIENNVLKPLMLYVTEKLELYNICENLIEKYILVSNSWIEPDLNNVISAIKAGKSVIAIEGVSSLIILDTTGGEYRDIVEPQNETVMLGSREGFVENLEINISLIRRKIKDSNLVLENLYVGRRTQTELSILYIKDIIEMDIVNEVIRRIHDVDVDSILSTSELVQYIEDYTYCIFPQTRLTEKPDIVVSALMEGKAAIILNGAPNVVILPSLFIEFFQTIEDHYERTLTSSFTRLLRFMAAFIVITLPSIYLTLIKFNAELIPIKFMTPIIQSRIGIALSPFLEILCIEIIVEFLREGGLRLPSKIGQTLSVVGGIIIGDTAVKSKIVSPTTLFIVGITVVASFLIPNFDMSLSIRLSRFPMLIAANYLGIFGIGIGWVYIIVSLCSLDSFGVPYISFNTEDLKDSVIRFPLWKMNTRPQSTPNNNPIRQKNFRNKWGLSRRRKNEESGE